MPKKGKGKYTDAELMALDAEVVEYERKAAALAKRAAERKATIIAEFQTRGTRAIEHGGKRLTLVEATSVRFDEDRLQASLATKVWNAITVRRMDKGLLLASVQSGKIDATLVDSCTTIHENAPYYRRSTV